ncbi:XdhC family protein [Erythrobacter sp. HA6-11]
MFDTHRIFQFLAVSNAAGHAACLVTVTEVTGASVRNPGAHMAVSADGDFTGSLSGGCIEKAVVQEALQAIEDDRPRQVAYGAGSPFIDIRLPCGGRVDLLLNPINDERLVARIMEAAMRGNLWSLSLPGGEGSIELADSSLTGWQDDRFVVSHAPPLKLMIAGHGASVEALVRLAAAMDVYCEIATPDQDIVRRLSDSQHVKLFSLERLSDPLPVEPDSHTACIFLFHDHEWEAALIEQALHAPAFYVGAMGSLKTHEARCEALAQRGVSVEAIARIAAPIGSIPSSRDPETLAISIIAQVVERYNALVAQGSGAPS